MMHPLTVRFEDALLPFPLPGPKLVLSLPFSLCARYKAADAWMGEQQWSRLGCRLRLLNATMSQPSTTFQRQSMHVQGDRSPFGPQWAHLIFAMLASDLLAGSACAHGPVVVGATLPPPTSYLPSSLGISPQWGKASPLFSLFLYPLPCLMRPLPTTSRDPSKPLLFFVALPGIFRAARKEKRV